MTQKYGLPNSEKTDIIEERYLGSTKFLEMPDGSGVSTPTHEDFIKAGWFLLVVTGVGAQEHPGVSFSLDVPAKTYTKPPTPWSQAEIDAAADLAAEQAEIAQAIVDGNLSDLTYSEVEEVIINDTNVAKKTARVAWALLKVYKRTNP